MLIEQNKFYWISNRSQVVEPFLLCYPLLTQDISALCVWCRSVSVFCVGTGHFSTSAEMSRTVRH